MSRNSPGSQSLGLCGKGMEERSRLAGQCEQRVAWAQCNGRSCPTCTHTCTGSQVQYKKLWAMETMCSSQRFDPWKRITSVIAFRLRIIPPKSRMAPPSDHCGNILGGGCRGEELSLGQRREKKRWGRGSPGGHHCEGWYQPWQVAGWSMVSSAEKREPAWQRGSQALRGSEVQEIASALSGSHFKWLMQSPSALPRMVQEGGFGGSGQWFSGLSVQRRGTTQKTWRGSDEASSLRASVTNPPSM